MVLSVGGSSGSKVLISSSGHGENTVTYDLLQHQSGPYKATSGLVYFLYFVCPSKEVISIMSLYKVIPGFLTEFLSRHR